MNKNELIGAVADASGLSRSDATKAVEGVFDTITRTLSKGDEVRLVGFGTFSVAKRKASTGRNPRTGAPMTRCAAPPPFSILGRRIANNRRIVSSSPVDEVVLLDHHLRCNEGRRCSR